MATVDIKNIGPISHLNFSVPDDGVVVLKARNGAGKSKALESIESLATGGKVAVRDGELHGHVEGWGAALTVSKSTRRSGELEVEHLDGRLNIADLVDPGLKDQAAADARRIKALVTLSGVEANANLFHELLDNVELFEEVTRPESRDTKDLVQMAAKIKRDLESQARKDEDQADTALSHAKAHREAAGEVDIKAEHDEAKLQKKLEDAIGWKASVNNQRETAKKVRAGAEKAKAKLVELGDPPAIGDLEYAVEVAEEVAQQAAEAVRKATEALDKATSESREAKTILESRKSALAAAKRDEAITAELHAAVKMADEIEEIDDETVAMADADVEEARKASEQGVRIRDALKAIEKAKAQEAAANAHQALADKFRSAAKGTDDVLSQAVANACDRLRVEAGRLVLDTSRGKTEFAELSEGERWKIALDIAIDAVGEGGLIVVPQHAWEALDPINRELIADHVKGTGVVVITAEATEDEEIKAETL